MVESIFFDGSLVWILALVFFCVALMYSSVGLGGGSSYTALLSIAGVGFGSIPTISLLLNLTVTSVGSLNYARFKHVNYRLVLPFLITSIPMAFLGGSLSISRVVFEWLLLSSLVFVAFRIYFWTDVQIQYALPGPMKRALPFVLGAILGMLAGIVGIGGGIFLVPLILVFNLGSEKEAAATGSIFILANSIAGVAARVQYHSLDWSYWWPVIAAVFLGGALGSYLGAARFSGKSIQRTLGIVIVLAIIFLTRRVI